MWTWLIQRIKAMLLCIVHPMLFVNTVDTKIKTRNALDSVCSIVCRHCQHEDTDVCGSYTSTVYRVMRCENSTLLCIQRPVAPPGMKACTAFCLVGLAVHQSKEAVLLTFWDLSTTRLIAGKMHSQSPTLKLTASSIPWLRLSACNWDLKGIFNAWRTWACRVPWVLVSSVFHKVGWHKQVGWAIHKLQHWMLG